VAGMPNLHLIYITPAVAHEAQPFPRNGIKIVNSLFYISVKKRQF
jgi:hypothetical protein